MPCIHLVIKIAYYLAPVTYNQVATAISNELLGQLVSTQIKTMHTRIIHYNKSIIDHIKC